MSYHSSQSDELNCPGGATRGHLAPTAGEEAVGCRRGVEVSKPASSMHRTTARRRRSLQLNTYFTLHSIMSLIHHCNRVNWSIHLTHVARLHLQIQYMPYSCITPEFNIALHQSESQISHWRSVLSNLFLFCRHTKHKHQNYFYLPGISPCAFNQTGSREHCGQILKVEV